MDAHGSGSESLAFSKRLWLIGLNLAAMALVAVALVSAARVVGWVLIAALFALALAPLVDWLERHRVRRGLAVAITALLALAVFGLLVIRLAPMIADQIRSLVSATPEYLERLRGSDLFQRLDDRFDLVGRSQEVAQKLATGGVGAGVLGVVSGLFTGLAALLTIGVLTVFLLLFGPELVHKSLAWVDPAHRETAWKLARRIRSSIGGYMLGLIIIGLIAGAITSITLAILGVPYFLALGLLVAVLSLVPFIGATIGIAFAALTALATEGWVAALIVVALMFVYQQVEGNLLAPLVQRKTIELNPLLITLALLFGTTLAGIVGTLLALPIAGTLMIIGRELLDRRQQRWVHEQVGETAPPLIPPPEEREQPPLRH